jgi:hypothetical protein
MCSYANLSARESFLISAITFPGAGDRLELGWTATAKDSSIVLQPARVNTTFQAAMSKPVAV